MLHRSLLPLTWLLLGLELTCGAARQQILRTALDPVAPAAAWQEGLSTVFSRRRFETSGALPLGFRLTNESQPDASMSPVLGASDRRYWAWLLDSTICWAIWTVAALVVYFLFCNLRPPVRDELLEASPEDTLKNGHFDCVHHGSDPLICLCAFCCPSVRWADTLNLAGILPAWGAFCLFAMLALLNGLSHGFVLHGAFAILLLLRCRLQLKQRFGLQSDFRSLLLDCCFVTLCPCCAIAQEANVVSQAYRVAHPAICDGPADSCRGRQADKLSRLEAHVAAAPSAES